MRSSLLGFLLLVVVLVLSDLPGRFQAGVPSPLGALAEGNDEPDEDDNDRDDHGEKHRQDHGEEYRQDQNGTTGGIERSGNVQLESRAVGTGGLTRGPYLQLSTPTSITIRWQSGEPGTSLVRYGTSPDHLDLRMQEQAATTEHEVQLTNLRPDTRYYYSIRTSTSTLAGGPDCSFRTSPLIGTERKTRVWLIGDSGLRGAAQQRVQQAYDAYSNGAETDVWLLLGDNAYTTGTSPQYQAGFFDPYAARLRSTVVWPSRGNHDETRGGPGNDYYDFFTLPTAGEAGGTPSRTEAWYSFDFANVHFVCLDAERFESRMIEWLRSDLAATDQDWVIAYWHHPPYSKGSHNSDSDEVMTRARRQIVPVLEEGGVDLVAGGHSHSYERSFLLDRHYGTSGSLTRSMILDGGDGGPDGDGPYRKPTYGRPAPHEGTVYVVVGSSSKLSGGRLDHRAHARSLNVLGSLVIEVSGNRLDAAFVDDQRRVADRFTIVKGKDPLSVRNRQSTRPEGDNAAPTRPLGAPTGRAER